MADTPSNQSTTPTPTAGAPAGENPPVAATPAVDLAALQAQLAKFEKENSSLKNEAAQRRIETKQERDAKLEAARVAGDLGTALKMLEAQRDEALKELETYKPDALAQREWREKKAKNLDAEAAKLAPHLKELYDLQPSVEAKAKFVKAMAVVPSTTTTAEPPKQPGTPAPVAGSPAPATMNSSLTLSSATPEQLEALKKSDPAAFMKLMQGAAPPKPTNSYGL